MDWVILLTMLQIIAVMARSIEKETCNRAHKSKSSLNQTAGTDHYTSEDKIDLSNLQDDNCTSEMDNETPRDEDYDNSKEVIKNKSENTHGEETLVDKDENNDNNTNVTHKYESKTTKREKTVSVDSTINQRSIVGENTSKNGSRYISTDDIKHTFKSNSERSKKDLKTDDSKIYVFKDSSHPVYQIKRVDRNDLRTIKLNKTPQITILRRKSNNKQVINEINDKSQNKFTVNKNVTEVRKNLLDHLLKYLINIMQADNVVENENENNISGANDSENHKDLPLIDEHELESTDVDASLNLESSSNQSILPSVNNEFSKEVNGTSDVANNIEENVLNQYSNEDVNQNNTLEDFVDNVMSILKINKSESVTEYNNGIQEIDEEINNVTEFTDTTVDSEDISIINDLNLNKTNNEFANITKINNESINSTKSRNETDTDLKIDLLLENVDSKNGTTINIDIPLNITEGPIVISANTEQNTDTIDFKKVKSTNVNSTELNKDSNTIDEVKTIDYEHEDKEVAVESNAEIRSEEDIQEQTRRILLGILDKNKSNMRDLRDGSDHVTNGNCDKQFKMHIDINVF